MTRIEDYALLGDLQAAALVGVDGSVDWLCLPRFDSPACFAALLGDAGNGRWLVAPAGPGATSTRRYRGDSLVLETDWETPDGAVRVIDFMPPRGEAPDVVRLVEGRAGTVRMRTELVVRFDYGHVVPWVRHRKHHRWTAVAGPDAVWLDTPVALEGSDARTVAEFDVSAGDRVPFVLTWSPSYEGHPRPVDAGKALRQTESFWADWI